VAIGLSYLSETRGCRPDAATTPLALRLTILPPNLPPPTALDAWWRPFKSKGKAPVREPVVEIFQPDWNCSRI
jgi:hypothetical protein